MRHPATIKTDSYHVGALRGLLQREVARVNRTLPVTNPARGHAEEYLAQLEHLLAATEAAS